MSKSCINSFILEINETENIDLYKIIKLFEKKLKKCFALYKNNFGFEDYKMNDFDYIVLHTLWSFYKGFNIEEYLVIMYSYYKIEDFYFPVNKFNCSRCLDIINNTNITYTLQHLIKYL